MNKESLKDTAQCSCNMMPSDSDGFDQEDIGHIGTIFRMPVWNSLTDIRSSYTNIVEFSYITRTYRRTEISYAYNYMVNPMKCNALIGGAVKNGHGFSVSSVLNNTGQQVHSTKNV